MKNNNDTIRKIPHNIEVEQALLGAIMVNNDAFWSVSEFLKPEHFYENLHQMIYSVAGDLIRVSKQATPITLKTFLPADQEIAGITVQHYLGLLVTSAAVIINAPDFGQAIYDLAIRRSLIAVGSDMVNIAYDSPVNLSPGDQIEDMERKLFKLAESGCHKSGFCDFSTAVNKTIALANNAFKRGRGLSGLASGFRQIDLLTGGMQKSDLIIIAGRPAMGKTALATNIAFNIASEYNRTVSSDKGIGGRVGFFSLEMSAEQLATRIISEQTEVSSSKIRRGDITVPEFEKLVKCSHAIHKIPLFIDETGGISIARMGTVARRLKRKIGIDIIIIDYIQLMHGDFHAGSSGNRVQEITEITTGLKALAKELDIPIIALSQLSRQVESRDEKRPQLSDLRESGSIEQDADLVLFVYREEYYVEMLKPDEKSEKYDDWLTKMENIRGKAEIIIAKHRHGPTGTAKLCFQGKYTRFSDLVDESNLPTIPYQS